MTRDHRNGAVVLREFVETDVAGIARVIGDPRVTRWLSFDARPPEAAHALVVGAIEAAARDGDSRVEHYFAVDVPERGTDPVGFVRLGLSGVRAAKLGYAIAASCQGRGYATEAVRQALGFAFGALGLHRVSVAIGPDNLASMRVAAKAGFVPEGRIRDHVFTNGAWRDSILYGLLRPDWEAVSRTEPSSAPEPGPPSWNADPGIP
ncbi:RimJ/RimL family protein N-acetyltransferase [Stackebrandtia albiflava]|uniref:RimJ/RimL family protein N-acetyltransferase n=1 Tax=Stackebrandtia albiflava TaxID=406432 RepID=A0A562VAZ0_9ACTN|nr:GNAT family protein [Stackebrandtia albiflava]TWJ15046.1 RimJ/RimL family protein N-acetyltransferase [Stackebrandtia albiflava]